MTKFILASTAAALMLTAPLANAAIVRGAVPAHASVAAQMHRADYRAAQQQRPQVNDDSHQWNYDAKP